jgi:hypothetical protein
VATLSRLVWCSISPSCSWFGVLAIDGRRG